MPIAFKLVNDIVDRCQYFRCGVFSIIIPISTCFCGSNACRCCVQGIYGFSLLWFISVHISLTSGYLSIKLKFTDINHIWVLFSLFVVVVVVVVVVYCSCRHISSTMNNMLFSFFLRGTGGDFIIWIDFILGWIICVISKLI